jgi:hypothetical protein
MLVWACLGWERDTKCLAKLGGGHSRKSPDKKMIPDFDSLEFFQQDKLCRSVA